MSYRPELEDERPWARRRRPRRPPRRPQRFRAEHRSHVLVSSGDGYLCETCDQRFTVDGLPILPEGLLTIRRAGRP